MNLYKTSQAATFINTELQESLEYWHNFLLNNRKLNRNPAYRIPCDRLSGDTVYSEEELLHFIEWEKYRRSGSIGLSKYTYLNKMNFDWLYSSKRFSRKFSCVLSIEKDQKTYKPFISFRLHFPIPIYKLTIDEAKFLRSSLDDVIKKIKSI